MSTDWTATHVAAIAGDMSVAPVIAPAHISSFTDAIDIWDAWPIQYRDGLPLELIDGTQIVDGAGCTTIRQCRYALR